MFVWIFPVFGNLQNSQFHFKFPKKKSIYFPEINQVFFFFFKLCNAMGDARLLNTPVSDKWITFLMLVINFRFLFDYLLKNIQMKSNSNESRSFPTLIFRDNVSFWFSNANRKGKTCVKK